MLCCCFEDEKKGAVSQGMYVASKAGKIKEMDSLLESSRRNTALLTYLNFGPVKPMSSF